MSAEEEACFREARLRNLGWTTTDHPLPEGLPSFSRTHGPLTFKDHFEGVAGEMFASFTWRRE